MIPQYRTLKLKLPKYRMKKNQYRNTVNPHVPLLKLDQTYSREISSLSSEYIDTIYKPR